MAKQQQQNLQSDIDTLLKSQVRKLIDAFGMDKLTAMISTVCLEKATHQAFEKDELYWEALYKKFKLLSVTLPRKE